MAKVLPLPEHGSTFVDVRGMGRSMRVSWHHDDGVLVISLWAQRICRGTFRMHRDEVPDFIDALTQGLSVQDAPTSPPAAQTGEHAMIHPGS